MDNKKTVEEVVKEDVVKEEAVKKPVVKAKKLEVFEAVSRLKHDGVVYLPGDKVEINDRELVERLKKEGIIK